MEKLARYSTQNWKFAKNHKNDNKHGLEIYGLTIQLKFMKKCSLLVHKYIAAKSPSTIDFRYRRLDSKFPKN